MISGGCILRDGCPGKGFLKRNEGEYVINDCTCIGADYWVDEDAKNIIDDWTVDQKEKLIEIAREKVQQGISPINVSCFVHLVNDERFS